MAEKVVIGNAELWHGDALEVLPLLTADAVVTDPPYGYSYESNHTAETTTAAWMNTTAIASAPTRRCSWNRCDQFSNPLTGGTAMSREKLDALLAGRPRPSGGMCLACLHRDSSCAHLPFKDMPVMRLDKDGTPVVRCTEFVHQQPTPIPAGHTSK